MTDLRERFRSLDSLEFPGIEAPKVGAGGPTARSRVLAGRSRHSKLVTIAVAFAIFLAAGVFAWRAFAPIERGGKRAGVSPSSQLLYVLDSAPDGSVFRGDIVAVQATATGSEVVATYPLGDDPDAAISPDGTRLYGVGTTFRSTSMFKVYDTATHKLIKDVPVPDRQGTTGFHLTDKITVSPDGSRVYILVGESDVPPHKGVPQGLATFDTLAGVMLPHVIPLPRCVDPTILPGTDSRVTVVCRQIDEVRFLQVSGGGGLATERRVALPRSGSSVTDANGNAVDVSYVSQAVLSPDGGTVYAVTPDGVVFVIDVGTQRVTREVQLPLPTGYVVAVPQVTLSPSGDGLYLGLGAYLHGDLVHATTILGVDTATWQKTTTERTPAFSAFRVANDGSRIFAVNEKSPTLGVVGLRPVTGYVPFGTVAGRPLAIFTTAAPTQASVPSGVTSYHAPAGWTIGLPAGWQAVPFSTSKEGATAVGVQLSNVTLPPPTMVPGYPIQTNGRVLPSDGVSLIIGTDQDPRDVQQPPQPPRPLPVPPLYNLAWRMGSAGSDSPYVQLLWFEWNRQIYIASAKVGPQSTPDERAALDEIILSLRFPSITPSASGMGISGPLIGGSYVTLTQAQGIARVPLDRPQSDLASDPGLTSVWVSSPSDPPAVRFDYASGVTVVLTLWPDGKDPATSYATQREQTGGFGSLTTINGNPAYIVGQNAVPTPVTIRSSAGGSTTVSQVDPSIATVDMSIGDVDVLIRGQFSASKLVKVAESVQP